MTSLMHNAPNARDASQTSIDGDVKHEQGSEDDDSDFEFVGSGDNKRLGS